MAADIHVTDHAVQRFRERVAPHLGTAEARAAILASLATVTAVSAAAHGKAITVRTAAPYALRIVIAAGDGPAPRQVVTVLPGAKGDSPSDARHRRRARLKRLLQQAADDGMEPLRVVAHTPAGYAASDPWSPSLDGILAYHVMRQRLGDAFALAQADDAAMQAVEGLPLAVERTGDQWWYLCSAPVAEAAREFRRHYHRRFDADAAARYMVPQQGRILTTAGPYKNSRLSHIVRLAPAVTWHCIGRAAEIEDLLARCTHIGRGAGTGMGRVARWEVTPEGADPALAMCGRPVPAGYAERHAIDGERLTWGLRPPMRLPAHQALCVMP